MIAMMSFVAGASYFYYYQYRNAKTPEAVLREASNDVQSFVNKFSSLFKK